MKILTIEHGKERLTYFTVEEMKNHLMLYTDDLQNFSIPVPEEFVQPDPIHDEPLEITENGLYDVIGYAKVDVNVDLNSKLKELIERSVEEITIPEDTNNIGNFAFASCTELENIEIPDHIEEVGQGAFMNCINLFHVKLPENMKTVNSFTFQNCWRLSDVQLPNVDRIGDYAFQYCHNIINITLPSTITSMGTNVFQYCDNLNTIYCDFAEGTVAGAPWGAPNATVIYNQ